MLINKLLWSLLGSWCKIKKEVPVKLDPEPNNPYDAKAIALLMASGRELPT